MALVKVDSLAARDAWWASRKPEMDLYNAFFKHLCPAYDKDMNDKRDFYSTKAVPICVNLSGFINYVHAFVFHYDCMESNDVLFYRNSAMLYAVLDYIRNVYGQDCPITLNLDVHDTSTGIDFYVGKDSKTLISLTSLYDDNSYLNHRLVVAMPYMQNQYIVIPDSAGVKEVLDSIKVALVRGFQKATDRNKQAIATAQKGIALAQDRLSRA